MGDRVMDFARANKCAYARWYGKRGWMRIIDNASIIGQHDSGHLVYERAA
jgi:hypothetical protein